MSYAAILCFVILLVFPETTPFSKLVITLLSMLSLLFVKKMFLFLKNTTWIVRLFLLSWFAGIVVNSFFISRGGFGAIPLFFLSFLIAIELEDISHLFLTVILLLFGSIIIVKIVLIGMNSNDVFALLVKSRNYISIYALLFSTALITKYFQDDIILVWPSAFSLFLAVLGVGRSGIVAAILLFSGVFYLKYRYRYIFIIFLLILALLLLIITFQGSSITGVFEKITGKSFNLDSGRYEIWKTYIINQDLKGIFLGYDASSISQTMPDRFEFIRTEFKGNLHSSILYAHYRGGILAIFSFFIVILIFFKNKFSRYTLVLAVLFIRMSTDLGLYTYLTDCFFFYILFAQQKVVEND